MPDDKTRTTLDILGDILAELREHRRLLVSQGEAVMSVATSLGRLDEIPPQVVALRRDVDELAEVVTALVNNGKG